MSRKKRYRRKIARRRVAGPSLPFWDDQRICRQVANWYADGHFYLEEAALHQYQRVGTPTLRRRSQTSICRVIQLFDLHYRADVSPVAVRRALAGLAGVPVGHGGCVNVEDLAAMYRAYWT